MLSKQSSAPPSRLLAPGFHPARAAAVRLCYYGARHSRPACVRLAARRDCDQGRPRLLLALSARRLGGRGLRGAALIARWRPEGAGATDGGEADVAGAAAAGAASPLTPGGDPGGGESDHAERGAIIGVCEQFVDAWWRGVARGVDSATETFSQLLVGASTAAVAAAAAAPPAAASAGGGAAAGKESSASSVAVRADAAHPTARKHDHHLHLSWRRSHEAKRPTAQAPQQVHKQPSQPREAPAEAQETSFTTAPESASSSTATSPNRGARASPHRDEEPAPAAAAESAPAFVLMPDGVLHRRPLRGYGALLTQLAAQHAEYHRVQYRPVASAANAGSGVCYVLGEFRMQDVGGLAGHPATFRISKGNCLYKFKVEHKAAAAAAAVEQEGPDTEIGASSGAAAAGSGSSSGRRHILSKGWVRRQMTQEERDERVWDPVHVYPAPFPIERLHLTRGGRPDAAAMEEAACAWVAAQAKPRRRGTSSSTAAPAPATAGGGAGLGVQPGPGVEPRGGGQRVTEEGAGGGGGITSMSKLGEITSTDPHRADKMPDTMAGSSTTSTSSASSTSSSSSSSHPWPATESRGRSGVCGGAQQQEAGAPRVLVCSWSGRHAAPTASGAPAHGGLAEAQEETEEEADSGLKRVQQHLASRVLSSNCRLHDAYGIYPSPEDLRLLPGGAAGAGGYGSKRSQQPVLGPEAILQRIQAQQRLTDCVEPLLYDVAVSADHNIAFVHFVNVITPSATAPEPTAAPVPRAAASSQPHSPSSGGAAAKYQPTAAAVGSGQGDAGADAQEARGESGAPAAAGGDIPAAAGAGDTMTPASPASSDAGLGLQVSGGGSSPGGVLTSGSGRSSAASIAAVSSVATAAANAAAAASQAATAAAGVATTAASAANVAASTASTAATMAATAATAAAFMAASSQQGPATPAAGGGAADESAAAQGQVAAASRTATGTAGAPRALPPAAANQRDGGVGASAAPTPEAAAGGGGGGDGPLNSLDLRLQERLHDLRLAMPQVQMQMPVQMQGLEEVITAAAQRVAGAAGTAAAAASAAAAAATAVIMAEQQAQQQSAAAAAGGKAASSGAAEQMASGVSAAPPPPPVPYQQENMAALLFDDDGALTDVWLLRSPFHWERRLLRP